MEIADRAFYRRQLKNITIPNTVVDIGALAFGECHSLVKIIVDKPNNSITGAPWGVPGGTNIEWLR